ncbi:MAG: hypothetical protein GYB65_08915 [Chloroflexi bacterium]|nr:hypothetical protein [Chloroflexota bacterium]
MTTRQLLYATTNPGKVMEVRKVLAGEGLDVLSPADLGLTLDVAETGHTLEENATLKARAYLDAVDGEFVVIGDDTGVEIDALGGEPGIHVRRWDGSARMTDEAIIAYCLDRLRGVPPEERGAQFRTAFAIGITANGATAGSPRPDAITLYDGTLRGTILEQPAELRIAGFPFESLFFVPEWGQLLGEVHQLPPAEKARYVTHRERALRTALPHIRALLTDGRSNT